MLKEAKILYDLGFAVHWIRPNSKAPVKSGWSSPKRDGWENVKKEYREGFGLGVRLGEPSKLSDGTYLANIDIDLKSGEERHKKEALSLVREKFPGLKFGAMVKTGYGFRIMIRTAEPIQSGKLGSSGEECVVFMPTTEVNKRQERAVLEGRLSQEQLLAGYRVRTAWEVELMSAGKQVVLPPSKHPETGKAYLWLTPVLGLESIPLATPPGGLKKTRGRQEGVTVLQGFTPERVEVMAIPVSQTIKDMILDGEGVSDESSALMSACLAMLRAQLSDNQILSVLTNRDYFLGNTAYRHRNTEGRKNAAAWVNDYTLRKAKEFLSAERAFNDEVEISPQLDPDMALEQAEELGVDTVNWESWLTRSGKNGEGPVKPTIKNVVVVLTHAVGAKIFERNTFSGREQYGIDAPWDKKRGELITDTDVSVISHWLSVNYQFEPNLNIIYSAIAVITHKNSFHPVRDYFAALPPWDGVGRIDKGLARYHNAEGDPEYLAQVFRKWLVAAITRIYEPGAKFDWMPILEGVQGAGKSSFGAILAVKPEWYRDELPVLTDKDAALALQGSFIVEMGELSTLRRSEVEAAKGFITRQVDKVRPPYGRKWLETPRQCVFFGTTNREEYFRDDSGNRRFNPVSVGKLDFGALIRDRDQLWAEAKFIYENDLENKSHAFCLEGVALTEAVKAQEDKLISDESSLMAEILMDYFDGYNQIPPAERFNLDKFRVSDLFNGINGPLRNWKLDHRNASFAGKALKIVQSKYLDAAIRKSKSRNKVTFNVTFNAKIDRIK